MTDLWQARQRATGRHTPPQPTTPASTDSLLPVPYGTRVDLPPANDQPAALPNRTSDTLTVAQWAADHNLPGYVAGRWVWLEFDAKPDANILALVKSAGFIWVHGRRQWAHSCGVKSRKGRIDPRLKYGAVPVGSFRDDEE